ncbi:Peptidase family M23 [Hymenobacter daecheongensis DSM 21074]|uniref:Peptidase family M23 n=1 Tax=Hymenobacter daecheongensis DSM 21074 TaxID=1121955 RepID=A0A1M6I297_9BACT|nr:M23 family metallopeptidase [Hymenobacter daecheongensis]SHJ28609.1 Peptidase family M23 [Hymenobacter daecheongensis DSM 21074]
MPNSFLPTAPRRLLSLALPFVLLLGLRPISCGGQEADSAEKRNPKPAAGPAARPAVANGYFLLPIKPGQPNFLAASMGELRPNHFHGGLDIKTDGRVDLPVYAAAEGYISRLKQSSFGYGNVLYITHPNGLTTVYGHLNRFLGPVAGALRQKQYEKQTYEQEMFFAKDQFPVKRGEVVALSGNTGGSAGPHLHWEVRDAQDNQLNPLQWGGFAEIQDHIAPMLQAFAVEPLSIDARVQGRFDKAVFVPKTIPTTVWPDTITAFGTVGVLLQAFDRFDNAWNKNGLQRVEVRVNGQPLYAHTVDNVPFPEGTRAVNQHVDYEWMMTQGRTLQKLFVDDGNPLSMYTTGPTKGRLRVEDGKTYTVGVKMSDSYGNVTPLTFVLRGRQPSYTKTRSAAVRQPALRWEITRNILKVIAADPDTARQSANAVLLRGSRRLELKPSYTTQSQNVYLYDLRAGLPDSIRFGPITKRFDRQALIPSGTEQGYADNFLNLSFGPQTLFDTLYLQTSYKDGIWTVQSPRQSLYLPLRLTLKPTTEVADKTRSAVYLVNARGGRSYVGGKWDGNQVSFATKVFGRFGIFTDTIPPTVRLVSRAGGLVFKVGDDLSGLASYQLLVGGRFRLLRYEHKNATLFTERPDTVGPPLRGPATLRITDQAGNERVVNLNL